MRRSVFIQASLLLVLAVPSFSGPRATWNNIEGGAVTRARARSGQAVISRADLLSEISGAVDVEIDAEMQLRRINAHLVRAQTAQKIANARLKAGKFAAAGNNLEAARRHFRSARRLRLKLESERREALDGLRANLRGDGRARINRAGRTPMVLPPAPASRPGTAPSAWSKNANFMDEWNRRDVPLPIPAATVAREEALTLEEESALGQVLGLEADAEREILASEDDLRITLNEAARAARDQSLLTRVIFGAGVVRGEVVPYGAVRIALDAGSLLINAPEGDDGLALTPARISRIGFELGASLKEEILRNGSTSEETVIFAGLNYLATSWIGVSAGVAHHDSDVYPYGAVSISLDMLAF